MKEEKLDSSTGKKVTFEIRDKEFIFRDENDKKIEVKDRIEFSRLGSLPINRLIITDEITGEELSIYPKEKNFSYPPYNSPSTDEEAKKQLKVLITNLVNQNFQEREEEAINSEVTRTPFQRKCSICPNKIYSYQGSAYCDQHKPCSTCYNIIYSSEEYCSSHKARCIEHNCSERVAKEGSYCSQHKECCIEENCSQRIPKYGYTVPLKHYFCSNHQYSCKYKGDKFRSTQQLVNPFSCQKRVKTANTYCSSHSNSCASCSNRISGQESYC